MLDPNYKAALDIVNNFNIYWDNNYSYVEKTFTDHMIIEYYNRFGSIAKAADLIYDWSLANGDADVQE